MKILGYEFRKFEKETTTLETIETWCVKWYSLHRNIIDDWNTKFQVKTFICEEQANLFAKELRDARKLLGDKGCKVSVTKEESHTN